MKFWEAMRELRDGKKVRCCNWEKGWYVDIHTESMHYLFGHWKKSIQSEWELCQEPIRMVSFSEMVAGLRRGKKFRKHSWTGQPYLWITLENRPDSENFIVFECGLTTNPYQFTMFDFEGTDWIEV